MPVVDDGGSPSELEMRSADASADALSDTRPFVGQASRSTARSKRIRTVLLGIVAFAVLLLCSSAAGVLFAWTRSALFSEQTPPVADGSSVDAGLAATVLAAMDQSVNPCDDFYQFACGGWLRSVQIPADRTRWTRGFSTLDEKNQEVLRRVLEQDWPVIGTFYRNCMDQSAVDAAGSSPLEAFLTALSGEMASGGLVGVMRAAGFLHAAQVEALFSVTVSLDAENPTAYLLDIGQGGLSLPDRELYLSNKSTDVQLRTAFLDHIVAVLEQLHPAVSHAEHVLAAHAVLDIETQLANASLPRAELRDSRAVYHPMTRQQLQELTPLLPWDEFFVGMGFPNISAINVQVPAYLSAAAKVLDSAEPAARVAYLRWRSAAVLSAHLSAPFADAHFAFFGHTLLGQQQQAPRWRRCVDLTDQLLGEILGRYYVQEAFAGDSRPIAVSMIERVEQAFALDLEQLSWMDRPTKQLALQKLHRIVNKIGYPNRWTDYGSLFIAPGQYFDSVLAALRFNFALWAKRVDTPVDRELWYMTPSTVNAYYDPAQNAMAFPAGILQAPFFNRTWPLAMRYGGIGMVVGHELTHGFDDDGRKFDAEGRLRDWWTADSAAAFEQRAECVADMYSAYEVQPGYFVNGRLTLGENIADMGGIKLSYAAFRSSAAGSATSHSLLPTFTDDQLFFVAFAQTWCGLTRPETERVRLATDPHSPPRFRVNGPLSSLPAFAQAFSCPVGSAMRPAQQCDVW